MATVASRRLGAGGSIATMLALFPSDRPGVDSFFWCTPGVEVMTNNAWRLGALDKNMSAFATNGLMGTHYDDFFSFVNWSVVHAY